jgi:hypothetical protein
MSDVPQQAADIRKKLDELRAEKSKLFVRKD